jgi:hypothetical protein
VGRARHTTGRVRSCPLDTLARQPVSCEQISKPETDVLWGSWNGTNYCATWRKMFATSARYLRMTALHRVRCAKSGKRWFFLLPSFFFGGTLIFDPYIAENAPFGQCAIIASSIFRHFTCHFRKTIAPDFRSRLQRRLGAVLPDLSNSLPLSRSFPVGLTYR